MDKIDFLDSISGSVDKNLQYAIIRMVHSTCSSLDLSSSLVCGVYVKEIDDEYDIQIVADFHDSPISSHFPGVVKNTFEANRPNMDTFPVNMSPPDYAVDNQKLETMPGMSSEMLVRDSYVKIGAVCKSDSDCWYVMTPSSIMPRVMYFKLDL